MTPKRRTLAQHFKGAIAYATIQAMEAKGESILVDKETADHRAVICANCQPPKGFNVDVPGTSRTELEKAEDEALKAKVGGRTTPFDECLGKCNVCSCQLRTIVHLVPKVLLVGASSGESDKYPSHCWKKQLFPNK